MPHHLFSHLLENYGYWAVFGCVALEGTGVPFPGETMLLTAAVYAGTTHDLRVGWVLAAACAGAVLGDNLGYFLGYRFGFPLLRRYGPKVRIDERRLKMGIYLFRTHGVKVVFVGRFIALLRALAPFLAGANAMPWPRFALANAAGGGLWAAAVTFGGVYLGVRVHHAAGHVRVAILALIVGFIVALALILRKNEQRISAIAERALPGPIDDYHQLRPKGSKP